MAEDDFLVNISVRQNSHINDIGLLHTVAVFANFENVKNMSSLIANKIKINLCLVLNQFFIVHTIPCAVFNYLP